MRIKLIHILPILAFSVSLSAEPRSGEIDFEKYVPATRRAIVEVHLKSNIIGLAAKFVETEDAEAAKLLRSIDQVRVNVVQLDGDKIDITEKQMMELRTHLEKTGWERVVSVHEKSSEDVGVYLKARGQEAFEGIVVTVLEGRNKEAVFINIVGDIKPDQIAAVGKALHIEPLKKVGEALRKK
jgi:hypothetical protein